MPNGSLDTGLIVDDEEVKAEEPVSAPEISKGCSDLEDTESTLDLAALAKETFAEVKVTKRDHVQTDLSTVPVTIVGRKVTQNRNVLA